MIRRHCASSAAASNQLGPRTESFLASCNRSPICCATLLSKHAKVRFDPPWAKSDHYWPGSVQSLLEFGPTVAVLGRSWPNRFRPKFDQHLPKCGRTQAKLRLANFDRVDQPKLAKLGSCPVILSCQRNGPLGLSIPDTASSSLRGLGGSSPTWRPEDACGLRVNSCCHRGIACRGSRSDNHNLCCNSSYPETLLVPQPPTACRPGP